MLWALAARARRVPLTDPARRTMNRTPPPRISSPRYERRSRITSAWAVHPRTTQPSSRPNHNVASTLAPVAAPVRAVRSERIFAAPGDS